MEMNKFMIGIIKQYSSRSSSSRYDKEIKRRFNYYLELKKKTDFINSANYNCQSAPILIQQIGR